MLRLFNLKRKKLPVSENNYAPITKTERSTSILVEKINRAADRTVPKFKSRAGNGYDEELSYEMLKLLEYSLVSEGILSELSPEDIFHLLKFGEITSLPKALVNLVVSGDSIKTYKVLSMISADENLKKLLRSLRIDWLSNYIHLASIYEPQNLLDIFRNSFRDIVSIKLHQPRLRRDKICVSTNLLPYIYEDAQLMQGLLIIESSLREYKDLLLQEPKYIIPFFVADLKSNARASYLQDFLKGEESLDDLSDDVVDIILRCTVTQLGMDYSLPVQMHLDLFFLHLGEKCESN